MNPTPLWQNGHISIWAFHHVLTEASVQNQIMPIPEVEVSAAKFEQLIINFLGKGGKFLSIDELTTTHLESDKPYVTVTFDDGYLNNLEVAYPILKKYQVPACIYLMTGYPDAKAIDTWTTLSEFIKGRSKISIGFNGINHQLPCETLLQKQQVLCHLYSYIEEKFLDVEEKELFFLSIEGLTKDDLYRGVSWQQAQQLAQDPLITIGSHTLSHPRLTELNSAQLADELIRSKARLEEKLNTEIKHFAYPYGHYGERERTACEAVGYKTATTIDPGFIHPDGPLDMFAIPRLYLNADLDVMHPGEKVLSSIQSVRADTPYELFPV